MKNLDKLDNFIQSPKGWAVGWVFVLSFIGFMYIMANREPKVQEIKQILATENINARNTLDTMNTTNYVVPDKRLAMQDSARYHDSISTFIKKNYKSLRKIRKEGYIDEDHYRQDFEQDPKLAEFRDKYRQSLINLAVSRQKTK